MPIPTTLGLLALLVPTAAFVLLALVRPLRATGKPAAWLSILAATAATVCAGQLLVDWTTLAPGTSMDLTLPWLIAGGEPFGTLGVHLDGASVSMLLVVTSVALCVQVFSLGYLHDEAPASFGRYYTFHSLFLVAMTLLVLARDLLQLFVGWELVGLASYLLIGYYWQKPSAARAAVKAFWTTKLADIGLGAALVVLYAQTHRLDWSPASVTALGPAGCALVAGLLFVAVMGKSAQFPLHIWLPDAMEGPTPVSALLHAATMVAAGVFLVVRAWPIFAAAPDVLTAMTWIGSFTAIFASVIACGQSDIKKVLAYSTCAQLGYMVAGLGAGSLFAGYFHLFTHAFFKALLFLGAGCLIHAVHSNDLQDMGGLWRKLKLSGTAFVIGALALAGIPGLAGFFSKDAILEALQHGGHLGPLVLCLASAGLTAFYMTRVVGLALLGPASKQAEHAHESPVTMLAPVLLLAVGAVGAGYYGPQLGTLLGHTHEFRWSGAGLTATGLGLAGVAVGMYAYGPTRRDLTLLPVVAQLHALARSAAVDRAAQAMYARGLLGFSTAISWLDRYLVDAVMNLTAWAGLSAGERVRAVQTGKTYDYVTAVVAGLILVAVAGALGK
jgi:NADH-quinone oxidoreductase subunit L